jgi:hypothetical protein
VEKGKKGKKGKKWKSRAVLRALNPGAAGSAPGRSEVVRAW